MKKYRDHYFKKAKQENYPARSVYKLQEINHRFKLLWPGQKVLDLGAYPGSWSMFAAQQVGKKGLVLGVDLQQPEQDLGSRVRFMVSDILDPAREFLQILQDQAPFDLVLSDLAPQTTGIKIRDQARSLELAEAAWGYARQYLRSGGNLACKVFNGPDLPGLQKEMQSCFKKVKNVKPKSSRAESKECFLLGLELKGDDQ
ncbi:MAG: RlmE family RNA methyltransferase [Desulfohalobiaceae bacterium]